MPELNEVTLTKEQFDSQIKDAVDIAKKSFIDEERTKIKLELEKKQMPEHVISINDNINPNEEIYPAGHIVRALFHAKTMNTDVASVIKAWGNERKSRVTDVALKQIKTKDMNTSTLATGGYTVPEVLSNELIPLLYGESVLRTVGIPTYTLPNGNMSFPKNGSGHTAYWGQESSNITKSSMTGEQVELKVKKLFGLSVMSNEMLRYPQINMDREVQNDLSLAVSEALDKGYLYGTGLNSQPLGIKNWIVAANSNAETGSISALTRKTDLANAIKLVGTHNLNMKGSFWLMNPQQYYDLLSQTVPTYGNPMDYSVTLGASNTIYGFPVKVTSNCPNDEVYFINPNAFKIGDGLKMSLEVFPNGAYYDGSNVVSGISTDQTVVRCIVESDIIAAYDFGASIITSVTWGD